MMKIEEFLDGDTCVIRAELPGIDPDRDVELSVDDGVLRLSATREEKEETRNADGYHSEFRYGHLRRSFHLPEGATEADVTATYKDGILEIRVPAPRKVEHAESRKIPIARS
jgi:HSP20 family protein